MGTKISKKAFAAGETTWQSLLMGAAFFVAVPALITAIAPVSYVHLERREGRITAKSKTCLLFCVPYSIQDVNDVESVSDRVRSGDWSKSRGSNGRYREVKAEDEGFLTIKGADGSLEVSTSPASIKSRVAAAEAFLADENAATLDLFCVSNWKFAVMAGGCAASLTVLYVVGVVVLFLQWVFKSLYRLTRIAPN